MVCLLTFNFLLGLFIVVLSSCRPDLQPVCRDNIEWFPMLGARAETLDAGAPNRRADAAEGCTEGGLARLIISINDTD